MNYTDYGGQLRTPKLSLADVGGRGPSSDIVTSFALFLRVRLPYVSLVLLGFVNGCFGGCEKTGISCIFFHKGEGNPLTSPNFR